MQGAKAGFNTHNANQPVDQIIGEQSFDLIVAFDVLEHLDINQLRASLGAAYRALRRGGRLIARVPSGDSPFSGAIQHGDITHQTIIGSAMVHQLVHDAGFNVEAVRAPILPILKLGLRVFLRRAMVLAVHQIAFALISRIFMGGGNVVLTPNMVFVLVKP